MLLGWTYSISGQVEGGSRLGSSIGFPTANITRCEDYKLLPADGVYAVEVEMKNKLYQGMMNMGSRPTVNDDPGLKTTEVHLFNFSRDIYSERIKISFISRLRDERKFQSIDALKKQLERDRDNAFGVFDEISPTFGE